MLLAAAASVTEAAVVFVTVVISVAAEFDDVAAAVGVFVDMTVVLGE